MVCRAPILTLLATLMLGAAFPHPSPAQLVHPGQGEWGDAPEGNVAYPALGVIGQFPTLFATAGAGYVWHGNPSAWFGSSFDLEQDGNGGFNIFPPYDRDECYGPLDTDAGLFGPSAYTIDLGLNVVPCDTTSLSVPLLGPACGVIMPFAATILDLLVQNFSGNTAVINILFDWNQDGRWGGQVTCPNGNIADEHAVVNLPVPDGYLGPLGGLGVPQIFIGPNTGNIWTRFSIMNIVQAPPLGWDGSGEFDVGETEDYLLRVGASGAEEYGDAPEDALAYPNGVNGAFPTCTTSATAGAIIHRGNSVCWFGPAMDFESDGNANDCPFNAYDQDECGVGDGDAGLIVPDAFTVKNGNFRPCDLAARRPLGTRCSVARWGVDVDIEVTNNSSDDRYVNVLADWDANGEWSGIQTCPSGTTTDEHVLVDWPVPAGFSGPLSTLSPPDFVIGFTEEFCWMRFSITDTPVSAGWDGDGTFGEGETEDYLVRVEPAPTSADLLGSSTLVRNLGNHPNPFNPRTVVRFTLASPSDVTVRVLDAAGRVVRTLLSGHAEAGDVELAFDGVDERGVRLPSGVYYADVRAGNEHRSHKLLMLK